MKINSIYIYLFLLAISCQQNKTNITSISYAKDTLDDEIYCMLISTNEIEDTCFDYIHNDIKFSKCIDGNYYTIYRTTNDSNFITEDNVYIGMSFNSVKKISGEELMIEPTWAFYFPLKSGWNAAFLLDEKTEYKTIKDSTVAFIFKREKYEKPLPKFDTIKERILSKFK